MAHRSLVVCVCFVSLCSLVVADRLDSKISAPLFAWANQQYFSAAGQASSASYQVYDDFTTTLQRFVSSAIRPGSDGFMADWLDQEAVQQQTPEVVLVVLGSQLKTSDLRSRATQSLLTSLHSLMGKAQSSITVPYIMHEAAAAQADQQHALKQLAAGLGRTIVVGCDGLEGQDMKAAAEQLRSEPGVVIMCTSVQAASAGTPESVAAELQQVQEAHDAIAALNKRQVTVYAVRPDAGRIQKQRRRLQASNADIGVCGQLCQTQVKWLEGMLAAFILAIAAFSGMCCLYMLDTPTRFEKPKEGVRTD